MNATEQKVAEKLKNLKQTGKNVKILTKELNNVSSPKLRSDILDFILFCEHEKPATWRISSFLDSLDEIANKTALIDGAPALAPPLSRYSEKGYT